MAKVNKSKKPPSRKRYDEEHRVRSVRLDKEHDELLDKLLEELGLSFSGYVKARIRKDEAMIEKRVEMLASRQVDPSVEDRIRSLESLVHEIVSSAVDTRKFPPPCPRCEDQELFKCEGRQTESATTNAWVSTWKCPKCGYFINTYKRIDPESIKWMDPDTFAIIDKPRTSSRHWAKQYK